MHEVDGDLYFAIEEKSHVMDITEKGRNLLSPINQIPSLYRSWRTY